MFCPQCGNICSPTDAACSQCGKTLVEAARRLQSSPALPAAPTLPGMSSTPTPLPLHGRAPMGTMLGVAVPVEGAPGAPPAPLRVPPRASPSTPPAARPASTPPPALRPPSSPPRFSTMLGVAPAGAGNQLPPGLRIELQLLPSLRRVLDRSYRAPAEIVADTVLRHGLAAMTDRHHLEQELWSEYARDVRLILCALEEGVPQRLAARGEALDTPDIQAAARDLAHNRGLAEEAAEYAVSVWAAAICSLLRPNAR